MKNLGLIFTKKQNKNNIMSFHDKKKTLPSRKKSHNKLETKKN